MFVYHMQLTCVQNNLLYMQNTNLYTVYCGCFAEKFFVDSYGDKYLCPVRCMNVQDIQHIETRRNNLQAEIAYISGQQQSLFVLQHNCCSIPGHCMLERLLKLPII